MNGYITEQCKLIKIADAAAAGTTDVAGAGVDMQANGGFDAVLFFTSFATAAANNVIQAEQSDDDAATDDYTALAASKPGIGSSDEDQWIDIQLPRKRYVRCVAKRGTSSALGDIWALLYKSKSLPLASSVNTISGTIYGKQLYHPDEGTP